MTRLALPSLLALGFALGAPLLTGCGSDDAADVDADVTGPDAAAGATRCTAVWDELATHYADAGAVGTCASARGLEIAGSLMNLVGVTIDNNGATMVPCAEVRCDAAYAYIVSNDLPHYDFVQTTPNALAEDIQVYRIPLAPQVPAAAGATAIAGLDGCAAAYDNFLAGTVPAREPAGFCATGASGRLTETLASGAATYAQIACLGSVGALIDGVSINGPNEAQVPDPFGNPAFAYPDAYGGTYGAGAALDLCGGHTGQNMHFHAVHEACFAVDDAGAPASSYIEAVSTWTQRGMIDDACTEESPVVGWAFDGHPIKGPCVCVARDGAGACTSVKHARSGWLYQGLASSGNSPGEVAALGLEGDACTSDTDCCPGGAATCNFGCNHVVVAGGDAGTAVAKQCTLLDYAWCTSAYVDRTATSTAAEDFVYMDRCNGLDSGDGYAYHATGTFPLLLGCYHGVPAAQAAGGGGGGGGQLPACQGGQTTMCCGDGDCEGPETAANCVADCA